MGQKEPASPPAERGTRTVGRGIRIFLTLAADFLLIGVGLCVFALFHHVLPRYFDAESLYSEETLQNGQGHFGLPGKLPDGTADPGGKTPSSDGTLSSGDASSAGTSGEEPVTPETVTTPEQLLSCIAAEKRFESSPLPKRDSLPLGCYLGENAMIAIVQHSFGEGEDRITYQAADIFVSSTTDLETFVCLDEDGNVRDGNVEEAAEASGAVFAVNTDYFKSRTWGHYVRNGIKYLSRRTENDVCTIYLDGHMEIIPGKNVHFNQMMDQGVWQMFTFGPSLFDQNGKPYASEEDMNIPSTYNLAYDNSSFYGFQSPNPRTALGYLSPGHYVVVTVDGRQEDYSRGATLAELAQILYDEGCTLAYNMDGGGSTQMFFAGSLANLPCSGRDPSDYLVIRGGGTVYRMEGGRWKEEESS